VKHFGSVLRAKRACQVLLSCLDSETYKRSFVSDLTRSHIARVDFYVAEKKRLIDLCSLSSQSLSLIYYY